MKRFYPTFHHGRVLWQQPVTDDDLPEAAIAGGIGNGGLLVLQQEGREIVVSRRSAPAPRRMIRALERAHDAERGESG